MAANFGGRITLEGADQYKADLANINSNLKLLSKEMENNARTVADLTQKTNLYNDKVNVQKRHIAEIEEALEKAKQKYGETSDEVQKWAAKLNNAQVVLIDMERDLKNAQKELDDFKNKFKQTAEGLKDAGEKMTALGDKLNGFSLAAGGAVTAVTAVALKSAAAADDLNTLSTVTGISTEELQKFAYASELIDVSQETITGSLRKLITNMQSAQNTAGKQREAFKTLRVSYENADGTLRSNIDVFYDVIDALGQVENSTEADAIAMNLFGKSAQDLNPLIKGGSDALKELGREAENAGLILSQDTLDSMNELNDAVDRFKATLSADMNRLGAELAPTLTPILEDMTASLGKVVDKLAGLDTKTIETGLKATALAAALSPLLRTLGSLTSGLGNAILTAQKLNGAFTAFAAANPAIVGVIAVLTAANAALAVMNKRLDENTTAANEMNTALSEQARKYNEVKARIDEKIQTENTELDVTKNLASRYEELARKTDRTASEQAELEGIVGKLNQKFPDLGLAIDGTTESINDQIKAIDELIKAQEREMEAAEALEKKRAASKNVSGTDEVRWVARSNVTAAMQALGDKDRQALQYVITEYNKGKINPQAVDAVVKALKDNPQFKDVNFEAIRNFQKALQDAQLAESRYAQAVSDFNKAQEEYKNAFSMQFNTTGGGTGAAAGKQVSSVSDLDENVKAGLETWKYRLDRGIITEQEYYTNLERIRDTYFVKDSKAWRDYDLQIYNWKKSQDEKKAETSTAAAASAAKSSQEILDLAKENIEAARKAYTDAQAHSYDWISERVYREDFGDFGTDAKESYNRIYQRALEAYKAEIISFDEFANEADKINAAKLADYKTEKQKMQNFIDDRNFYDDWDKYNTTEEKMYQRMLDNADKYFADRVLQYEDYVEEIRQLNRSIYTAQATEQENILQAAQDRGQRQLDEKRAEIDSQIDALNKQVSDLRASYATQDRQKRLSELKDEIKDYSRAVTLQGQEHLKSLQEEQERLLREQEIEDLTRKNNEIIEQLEAEYRALEVEKTSLLTKIEENTAQYARVFETLDGLETALANAVTTSFQKVFNDNSTTNNINNNNVTQMNTLSGMTDMQAIMALFAAKLKG